VPVDLSQRDPALTTNANTNRVQLAPGLRRSLIVRSAAIPPVLAAMLFLPAGRLTWGLGWLFVLVCVVSLAASAVYLWRVNPEIFIARSRIHQGTKPWDRLLLRFLFPVFYAVFVVAGFDACRFKWSDLPWWGVVLGYVLFFAGFALTVWAEAVNRFFEPYTLLGLRQLATRQLAIRIDHRMFKYLKEHGVTGPWYASERILVGLHASPYAVQIIRAAFRFSTSGRSLPKEPGPKSDYRLCLSCTQTA
jgi:hypothetical protein